MAEIRFGHLRCSPGAGTRYARRSDDPEGGRELKDRIDRLEPADGVKLPVAEAGRRGATAAPGNCGAPCCRQGAKRTCDATLKQNAGAPRSADGEAEDVYIWDAGNTQMQWCFPHLADIEAGGLRTEPPCRVHSHPEPAALLAGIPRTYAQAEGLAEPRLGAAAWANVIDREEGRLLGNILFVPGDELH